MKARKLLVHLLLKCLFTASQLYVNALALVKVTELQREWPLLPGALVPMGTRRPRNPHTIYRYQTSGGGRQGHTRGTRTENNPGK